MKNKYSQQGAVLIVSLIMLLLLTIIGVSGMRGVTMQERMAGNLKEQYRSFQSAEAALRLAEQEVEDGAANKLPDNGVNCDASIVDGLADNNFIAVATGTNTNEVVPQYHFRYCGPRPRQYRNADGLTATGDAGARAGIYVNYYTVIGVGRVPGNAETALISTYGM
ncbi:pilus assembly PilX family protein [Allochromatium palmeri]|uniref:Pilus assembly protein PilX n=1 Tax=Allochromatium palmeri TaxID=231048 RepID=A0A6N8EJW7_9GAMM|nr:PilX N-terminal domain-containing pilus assembly protein [Allochromatium palmeri]MTW23046.1 pilus assembly protein PilX [Allochromatium palmeri]